MSAAPAGSPAETAPELHDRIGWPIREEAWVYMERPSVIFPGRTLRYRGNVEGFDQDAHGPLVIIRTRKGGRYFARPHDLEVRPKPPGQTARGFEAARRTIDAQRRSRHRAELRKRRKGKR